VGVLNDKYAKEIAKELKLIRRELEKLNKGQKLTISDAEAMKIVDEMLDRTITCKSDTNNPRL